MPKFPWPAQPGVLAGVAAYLRVLPSDTLFARVYPRGGRHPTGWRTFRWEGPFPSCRFDHHVAGDRRGVLYMATNLTTCVAEVFQGSRLVDRAADDRFLAAFRTSEPVQLLDLGGDWPTRAGASQAISTGPRPRAQAWARAIYDAYPSVQGLVYPSSVHGGQPAVVLWERAEGALAATPDLDIPLSHPGLLPDLVRAADSLGYLLR